MKKIIISIAVLVIALVLFANMALRFTLDKGADFTIRYLIKKGKARGLIVREPYLRSLNLIGLTKISAKDFSMEVLIGEKSSFEVKRNFSIKIAETNVSLENFVKRAFIMEMKGIEVILHPEKKEGAPPPEDEAYFYYARDPDRLENGKLSIKFKFDFFNKRNAASEANNMFMNLISFTANGRASIPIEFTGLSKFRIKKNRYEAKVYTTMKDGEAHLIMDKAALASIIVNVEKHEVLGPVEVSIVSLNPLRAPTLLRILDHARDESHKAFTENNAVPEDAYKHILWAYHLTKTYGADFAQEVAEGHEVEDYDENLVQNRMDRINDKIGINYRIKGYPESELLGRCMNDPEVIKSASQLNPA